MNFALLTKLKHVCALSIAVLLIVLGGLGQGQPTGQTSDSPEPAAIPADQFVKLRTLIKPQPGELRFHEIPWLIDVWEARKKAAAEGKPILVWSGAGGAPIGVC